MSSPVDEMTFASVDITETPLPAAVDAAYGEDEEQLVQLARQEAVLRLARAM